MAEHPLIENVNHTSDRLLTPDETLPRIIGDTDDQLIGSKVYEREVKKVIQGLDRKRMGFNRKGEVELLMMVDDELVVQTLKIRVLPDRVIEKIEDPIMELNAQLPTRWEKEATWNVDAQVWEPDYVHDRTDPEYNTIHRKLVKAMRRAIYERAVFGLVEPFIDGQTVVWDSSQAYKYEVDDAIEYLHDMGITFDQVSQIANAVTRLSNQSSDAYLEELKKKQDQHSESHTD